MQLNKGYSKPKKLIQRQASLKGWRTRKRMQETRKQPMELVQQDTQIQSLSAEQWPMWKRRALPNPWLS